ncbi:MAG TPA: hypothetical protein VIH57_23570 [Bacteroidales bacterium]
MNIKLVLSTETKDIDYWTDLPFVPRINEWFNIHDFLPDNDLESLKQNAICWSGEKGIVQSIEYRHNNNGFFIEAFVWCED